MSKVNRLSDEALRQIDAFMTPGSLLKAARVRRGLSEGEVAERLKILPRYVAVLERDDYEALRNPAFARGYVRSYGRLLGLDIAVLERALAEFDGEQPGNRRQVQTRPLQLQRTGVGVAVGLAVLFVLVLALWWQRGNFVAPDWPEAAEHSAAELAPAAALAPGAGR